MPPSTDHGAVTVALLGNPNTGKSTVFNALCGVRQRVGNYPGVTVEKRVGNADLAGRRFQFIDLPGTYSLTPRSPDEMIVVDVLLDRLDDVASTDVILCIVDASNLDRNLYLVSQVLELGRPTIVALNMTDVARDRGVTFNLGRIRQRLNVPVIELQANRGVGMKELSDAIVEAASADGQQPVSPFPEKFQKEVDSLYTSIAKGGETEVPRFLVERLLLDEGGYIETAGLPGIDDAFLDEVKAARDRLAEMGLGVPGVETNARYAWVDWVLHGAVTESKQRTPTLTDKLDKVLTHKLFGTLSFFALMALVFQSVFLGARPAMQGIEWLKNVLGDAVAAVVPAGALQSLLVDGVIAGVGGVLVFLPQILLLFLFIAVLEDCGYMARAAFLMDRLMSSVGLSGKSFIPLLSSFACAVPGIMATRVIEDRRDRLVTILVAPLMSCSARMPVYALLIAAFIPQTTYLGGWLGLQGITMFAMYLVGIAMAIIVAFALKKTVLRAATPPFVLELPSYKRPSVRTVALRMLERGGAFIRQAGTLIFAASVVVWAVAYYPRDADSVEAPYRDQIATLEADIATLNADDKVRLVQLESELADVNNEVAGAYLRQSLLGRLGRLIEPAVAPLGWDWRIGCAVIASFPAREVVIGTLGVIYNLGSDEDEKSAPLKDKMKEATWPDTGRLVYNVPVALSIMVFFALCAQCAATLAVIKRETNSWAWPVFTFVYMTTLAYLGALATYQIGMLFV